MALHVTIDADIYKGLAFSSTVSYTKGSFKTDASKTINCL